MAKFYKSRFTAAQQDALLDIVEQGGSGGEGGGSSIEYLDISGIDESKILGFVSLGILVKIPNVGIIPPTRFALEARVSDLRSATAIAVDCGIEIIMGENMNLEGLANIIGLDITSIPRITKEEFYTL